MLRASYLFSSPTAHEPTLSTASAASLGGSLVEILAFLWVGATGAWETLCFGEGGLPLTVVALGAAIILRILKRTTGENRQKHETWKLVKICSVVQ